MREHPDTLRDFSAVYAPQSRDLSAGAETADRPVGRFHPSHPLCFVLRSHALNLVLISDTEPH
jgi:hypothetical protein